MQCNAFPQNNYRQINACYLFKLSNFSIFMIYVILNFKETKNRILCQASFKIEVINNLK